MNMEKPLLSKTKIDKIGESLRKGDIDATTLRELEVYRAEFLSAYALVEHVLRDTLGHEVTGRPSKSTVAIIEKLRRQSTRLTQVQDIAGCRVIVRNLPDQDSLCSAARIMLGEVEIDDKRGVPISGYRAVHLIVRSKEKLVEVQVRTRLQHAWAELSEKIADSYGQDIKYGKGEKWAIDFLESLSKQIARIENIGQRKVALERELRSTANRAQLKNRKKAIKALEQSLRLSTYKINELFLVLKDR